MPTKKPKEKGLLGMNTPAVVSPKEWGAAWQQMLVKEKAQMRARDALVAERRRMPWMAVKCSVGIVPPDSNPCANKDDKLGNPDEIRSCPMSQNHQFQALFH
jgi:hypothetical protein